MGQKNEGAWQASREIKSRFGALLRAARERQKISRANLAQKLDVSPKTVQSWEMGRTFIEDLSLVPHMEAELGISFHEIIELALSSDEHRSVKDASDQMIATEVPRIKMPLYTPDTLVIDTDGVSPAYKAIPEVTPATLETKVRQLQRSHILGYIPVPAAWCPRGGVIVATRIHDKNMEVMFPKTAILILDLRAYPVEKCIGRTVIVKKVGNSSPLIRIVTNDLVTDNYFAICAGNTRKGLVPIDIQSGDRILARVLGFFASPDVLAPR